MAIGTGLAAQIGYGVESTYGTRVVPTRFLEFLSEGVEYKYERIVSDALRAGQRARRSDRWGTGKKQGAGAVQHELANKGFGLIFKHALGSVASSQPNVGPDPTVWEHKAKLADPSGLMFSTQIGRPDVTGTVRPFDYAGTKIANWKISDSVGQDAPVLELGLDVQAEDTAQSLASASYPATQTLFNWTNLIFKIGGVQFDVSKFDLQGDNALATDRFFVGSQLKKEPKANKPTGITGTVEGEFSGLTEYARVSAGTTAAVTAFWTGATISGVYKFAIEITLALVRFDTATPMVDGPDIVGQKLTFEALDDASADAPIAVVYRTTDTAP